jgi:hypothetical protein
MNELGSEVRADRLLIGNKRFMSDERWPGLTGMSVSEEWYA